MRPSVAVQPPLLWRGVNAIRRWLETDDRLLVEHWKASMKPTPAPFLTVRVTVVRDPIESL